MVTVAGLRTNLLGLDEAAMRAMFAGLGEPPYRAGQVRKWIYHRQTADFMAMTDLSKDLRRRLAEQAEVQAPGVVGDQLAADGTRKWLFRLADSNSIETVYIPDRERRTLCVSSQVGCALNCAFCATARHGFNRNLHTAEIVGQVYLADRLLRAAGGPERSLTNVVLMGMGEPLLNYANVVPAMRIMLDDCAFGLSRRRVTLSTAGVVPAIDRLGQDCPVSLAVSLHAPDDALRDRLVPLNRKYPIRQLLDACRRYVAAEVRRKVTFEYTMLAGVNDTPAQARQLAALLGDIPAKVNLIPFNPVPGIDYRRSAPGVIDAFRDVLLAAGIITLLRKTRGGEIDAACGQLAGRFEDRTRRSVRLAALATGAP